MEKIFDTYSINLCDDDDEFVDIDIDDTIKISILAHMTTKDFDEAKIIVEDLLQIGPLQSEEFFNTFTEIILTASDYVDEKINSLIDKTILEIKNGSLKSIGS